MCRDAVTLLISQQMSELDLLSAVVIATSSILKDGKGGKKDSWVNRASDKDSKNILNKSCIKLPTTTHA